MGTGLSDCATSSELSFSVECFLVLLFAFSLLHIFVEFATHDFGKNGHGVSKSCRRDKLCYDEVRDHNTGVSGLTVEVSVLKQISYQVLRQVIVEESSYQVGKCKYNRFHQNSLAVCPVAHCNPFDVEED